MGMGFRIGMHDCLIIRFGGRLRVEGRSCTQAEIEIVLEVSVEKLGRTDGGVEFLEFLELSAFLGVYLDSE